MNEMEIKLKINSFLFVSSYKKSKKQGGTDSRGDGCSSSGMGSNSMATGAVTAAVLVTVKATIPAA